VEVLKRDKMTAKQEDHWDSAAYQNSASFVPKLATKVLEWLDVQEGDKILDVGCGGEFYFCCVL
jgi:protein-L-isoaspartate O-methyltransferase